MAITLMKFNATVTSVNFNRKEDLGHI